MSGGGGGEADLQSILSRHLEGDGEHRRRLDPRQRQVVSHVRGCRTAAMGGRRMVCGECAHTETRFHSCRDRHCPKCQRALSSAWCERQREAVLPVTYHHLVFTLPASLNGWVGLHPEIVYRALFGAAWSTLKAFGEDPKRLGGQLGMTAVLHTWGEALTRHVHLHCLVPGGALAPSGRWEAARSTYLFPVRALSRRFRGAFVAALRAAEAAGDLSRVTRAGEIDAVLERLMSHEWVVYSTPCPGRAETVVDYLGRYSHRIAISDERIVAASATRVSFRCKDYRTGGTSRTLTLDSEEFVRRYLLHVLPKGLMRVRHYGFLSNRCRRANLGRIRTALADGDSGGEVARESDIADSTQRLRPGGDDEEGAVERCPRCRDGRLSSTGAIAPRRLRES